MVFGEIIEYFVEVFFVDELVVVFFEDGGIGECGYGVVVGCYKLLVVLFVC